MQLKSHEKGRQGKSVGEKSRSLKGRKSNGEGEKKKERVYETRTLGNVRREKGGIIRKERKKEGKVREGTADMTGNEKEK